MSKDTPEVGDVWVSNKGVKIYITQTNPRLYCVTEKGTATTRYFSELMNYTYLGKSKANIDDLFKTENEE